MAAAAGGGHGGGAAAPAARRRPAGAGARRAECRAACCRLCGPAVLLVLALVAILGGSAVHNGWVRPAGLREHGPLELLLFGAELLLLVSSYLACVVGGPGFVPLGWTPEAEELREMLRQQPGTWPLEGGATVRDCLQWCRRCSSDKPPRAHHCSTCGRCALWMDHHCPWTNTCIGHDNLKSFTLFVHYVPIACVHALAIHSEMLWKLARLYLGTRRGKFWSLFWKGHTLLTILVWIASLVVALLVGSLAWEMHTTLSTNITFVEELVDEKAHARRTKCLQEAKFVFPYDLGPQRNWELVMGARGFQWLLPVRPSLPGYDSFWPPVQPGSGPFDLSTEQLAQKAYRLGRSSVARAAESFEGAHGGRCPPFWCRMLRRLGCRAVCCCEACGGARLEVRAGEELLVSFKGDDWVFGSRLQDGTDAPCGWVPRKCLDMDGASKYQVPLQAKLQGRWHTPKGAEVSITGLCVSTSQSRAPCALRAEAGATWLQGAQLLGCDGRTARWSTGEAWQRPAAPPEPIPVPGLPGDDEEDEEPGPAPSAKKEQ